MTESEKELTCLFIKAIYAALLSQKEIIELKLRVQGLTSSQVTRILGCESVWMQARVLTNANIKKKKRVDRIFAILEEWNEFKTLKKQWDDGYKDFKASIRKNA